MRSPLAPLRSFFRRERDRSPVRGLLIVLAVAAIPVVVNAVVSVSLPTREGSMLAFSASGTVVEAPAESVFWGAVNFSVLFGFWLLASVVAFAVTARAGGTGRFSRFATLLGWAWLPALLASAIWAAVMFVAVAGTTPPATVEGACEYCERVLDSSLVNISEAGVVVGWIVGLVIWIPAIEVGRDVSRRVAIGTVAVLVGLFAALWMAGNFLL